MELFQKSMTNPINEAKMKAHIVEGNDPDDCGDTYSVSQSWGLFCFGFVVSDKMSQHFEKQADLECIHISLPSSSLVANSLSTSTQNDDDEEGVLTNACVLTL